MRLHDGKIVTKDAIPRLLKQKLTKVVGSHRGQGGSPTLKNATSAVVRGVQLATGKKIRVLTIVDTFSRYVPALEPRFSYRAEDVVKTLEQICPVVGYPKTIRVDQGTEFVSRDLDLWAYTKGVTLDFSRPGKPTDNVFIEAFNGKRPVTEGLRSASLG